METTLKCPTCGFTKVVTDTDTYTQADLLCPSDEHPETELVAQEQDPPADDTKDDEEPTMSGEEARERLKEFDVEVEDMVPGDDDELPPAGPPRV